MKARCAARSQRFVRQARVGVRFSRPAAGNVHLPVAYSVVRPGTVGSVARHRCVSHTAAPMYTKTESGLKYFDEVVGEGPQPESGSIVKVHYTGTLEDGTKFDSSLDRGEPIAFPVGQGRVIAGWDEGILSMKIGGKRKLVIPPELGYGWQGVGSIPGNATLLFDCELVSIGKEGPQPVAWTLAKTVGGGVVLAVALLMMAGSSVTEVIHLATGTF